MVVLQIGVRHEATGVSRNGSWGGDCRDRGLRKDKGKRMKDEIGKLP